MVNSNAASITQKTTFGWHRIEVVGALSSLVFLGSLSFGTAIEAMQVIISCLLVHSGQETQKYRKICEESILRKINQARYLCTTTLYNRLVQFFFYLLI